LDTDFAAEIVRLSYSFPLSDTISPEPNLPLRKYIRSNLPPREEADYLWEQACQNALWQYNPHPISTFYPNLAYHCYSALTSSLSSRRLALLYMILAVGCRVDLPSRDLIILMLRSITNLLERVCVRYLLWRIRTWKPLQRSFTRYGSSCSRIRGRQLDMRGA